MKRVPAIFFRTASGSEPVREWIKGMPSQDRRRIGENLKTVEFGWPLGMPVCRAMGGGLHEVRTQIDSNRIARILFYIDRRQRLVVLHGFIKKSRKTPQSDLELARANKRLHERSLT